jgi:hypothetical protein
VAAAAHRRRRCAGRVDAAAVSEEGRTPRFVVRGPIRDPVAPTRKRRARRTRRRRRRSHAPASRPRPRDPGAGPSVERENGSMAVRAQVVDEPACRSRARAGWPARAHPGRTRATDSDNSGTGLQRPSLASRPHIVGGAVVSGSHATSPVSPNHHPARGVAESVPDGRCPARPPSRLPRSGMPRAGGTPQKVFQALTAPSMMPPMIWRPNRQTL